MSIGLAVPVYKNFEGFTRLMASVDVKVTPFIIPNYDENIGVSRGWNQAIERATEMGVSNLIIANDDIVFEPGAIRVLVNNFRRDDDLISMVNVRDGDPGSGWAEAADFACFLINPWQFTAKFGTFDEKFSPAYFEDNDMAYRIKLGGGKYRQILDARMHHVGSVTQNFGGEQVVNAEMFERNRAYYVAKWGGTPTNETYTAPFNGITRKTYKDW